MGRSAESVRDLEARAEGECRGHNRARPGAHRAIQGSQAGRILRASEDLYGQDPEVRPARAGVGGPGKENSLNPMAITEKRTLVYREELTPVSFIERSGDVHAQRVAVVDAGESCSYE